MVLANPRLGAEVLEHDPQRALARTRQCFHARVRKPAPESFDDDVDFGGGIQSAAIMPFHHFDPVDALLRHVGERGLEPAQRLQIVDPQPNVEPMLVSKQLRQPPAHGGIAEIVDDATENVPTFAHAHGKPKRSIDGSSFDTSRSATAMCENSSDVSSIHQSRESAMRLSMCGDAAFTVELGSQPNVLLTRAIAALHRALMRSAPAGFIESVPGLTSLTILFDPDATCASALQQEIERCLYGARETHARSREWHLPVCYADEYAPDLEAVAKACGMTADEVVAAHTGRSYVVYVIGFSPGFPYLGDLDERIVLPRRAEPRPRVPAGSVAIATRYTAVYPQSTAGGWHIIGRTPVTFFDAQKDPPSLLSPGDTVRFYGIDAARFVQLAADCAAGRFSLT